MGLPKKMEWLKWIRKYSTGILLDTKTGSMETLIDPGSSKPINYAYTSSVISDDEFVNAVAVATPQQRPMLPPPQTSDTLPSPPSPQLPNDVYDCCVSLDGIPIKHEFQYTLSDAEGYGKITKHDIEGLASKILESMYGTTAKLSSRGRRTVKVTLNIRPPPSSTVADRTSSPLTNHHLSDGRDRERRYRSSLMSNRQRGGTKAAVLAESMYTDTGCPIYVVSGSESQYRGKTGAQRYRHDQLIELVQRSLAENLSFQNQRKSDMPEACEDYYRPRTKRRQAVVASASVGAMQATPLPSPPTSKSRPQPAKVAWSPYDFEPVAHVPSNNHHFHEQLKNLRNQQQQKLLYGRNHVEQRAAIKSSSRGHGGGGGGHGGGGHGGGGHGGGRHRQHRNAGTAVVSGNNAKQPKDVADEQHTKNTDHQRYKRAKLASKKIHHHIHEHHHYHHYDYYIV